MLPIQIFILCLLLFSLLLSLLVLRHQIIGRLFFVSQFILGAVFVFCPDLSTCVAKKLGVGRGTDLLLYMMIMLFYVTALVLVARLRRIERNQTLMTRAFAIEHARKLGNGGEDK